MKTTEVSNKAIDHVHMTLKLPPLGIPETMRVLTQYTLQEKSKCMKEEKCGFLLRFHIRHPSRILHPTPYVHYFSLLMWQD